MVIRWPQHMRVDKRIVSLLSKQTYEDFPGALRELVSNAYDAGAKRVDVQVDPVKGIISVSDDGIGMSPEDFTNYLKIAGEKETRTHERAELNRLRIGQFGIGFLAALPYCEVVHVETKTRNSDEVIQADIPAHLYMNPRAADAPKDVEQVPIDGRVVRIPQRRSESGTRIRLDGLTEFAGLYFTRQRRMPRDSVWNQPWQERLRWELGQLLPIDYRPDCKVAETLSFEPPPVPMEVHLNGQRLYRNLADGTVVESSQGSVVTLQEGRVKFKFAILHGGHTVKPAEARGLQIRVRNVGVGWPNNLGLGRLGRTYPYLGWLYGEVQVIEGLNNSVQLTRNEFVKTPDYLAFEEHLSRRLHYQAMELENVETAKREIEREQAGGKRYVARRRGGLVSKKEIIQQDVKKLQSRGFTVEKKRFESRRETPVTVDVTKKTVLVVENHPDLDERVTIGEREYRVLHGRWPPGDDVYGACRFPKRGTVELNRDYPLFAEGREVETMVKIHVVLAETAQTLGPRAFGVIRAVQRRLVEVLKTGKENK